MLCLLNSLVITWRTLLHQYLIQQKPLEAATQVGNGTHYLIFSTTPLKPQHPKEKKTKKDNNPTNFLTLKKKEMETIV